jgi:predicted transcriptional regulator
MTAYGRHVRLASAAGIPPHPLPYSLRTIENWQLVILASPWGQGAAISNSTVPGSSTN